MNKKIAVVILAAGKGTRMKSRLPKVLHPICGRPMVSYVLELVKKLKVHKKCIVVGTQHDWAKKFIPADVKIVVQKKLLGTGDAIKSAAGALKGFGATLLVLYADNPLLKPETIEKLLKQHRINQSDATLITADVENPFGYGRIVRDTTHCIKKITEEAQANDFEKDIKEINTGIICFEKGALFNALKEVRPNNRKKEFFLTDVIEILYKKGAVIDSIKIKDIDEAMGVNSQEDLSKASSVIRKRILKNHMDNGVCIQDPATAFIDWDVKIGQDSIIYPFTVIESGVKIGSRCKIGPFCHLREGTVIGNDVFAGNFLELVRSQIKDSVFVKHFAYLGDSLVGKGANIGAGTVVANFDGKQKHRTIIKDGAFIGCDSVLVAPVEIGRNATTGAGCVVTKGSTVVDNSVVAGVPARLLRRGK